MSIRLRIGALVWLAVHTSDDAVAQAAGTSAVAGSVVTEDGRPVEGASVRVERNDRRETPSREGVTDARGSFRIDGLAAGVYAVTARRIGYRPAELPALRLAVGQTASVRVTLSQAPRQLSAIVVVTSPISIDAGTPELPTHLDRDAATLLPTARDASSLVALVPGARRDQLWGGAGAVANDYRLDGISVSHPGTGGDFLVPSIDWIEALEVRGLGAGAEYGNFQGGVVNAITKSGTNALRGAVRTSYESARLTATNLNVGEEGAEQAGRREIAGELAGPLARDRLFFFVAGQGVRRDVRAPNLATAAPRDFQPVREAHRDDRGLAKLTWLPVPGDRVDLLVGLTRAYVDHADLNGIDDPGATRRASAWTTFYEAAWTAARSARSTLDVRLGGFVARQSRLGYAGSSIPAVRVLQLGRQPAYQNAPFDERLAPSSFAATATWRGWRHALGADHQLVVGGEIGRGAWRDDRTRNGGLTWRPYRAGAGSSFDPTDATSWGTTGSDWGGEIHLDGETASGAAFVQDYVTLGARLTVALGVRFGQWTGWLTPACSRSPASGDATGASASECASRFKAARDDAVDPRLGVAWDVTGRSALVLKGHWGRYHQGMFPLFFDRAAGADAYTNQRFYYYAPPLTDSRTTYTPAQRDSLAGPGGFSAFYDEVILNESGRVEGYRQPYVDQTVLGVERAVGAHWKLELLYVHRSNGDIVGLVDRHRSGNYSRLRNVRVIHRLGFGDILDADQRPLVLPEVYVANSDLIAVLERIAMNARDPEAVRVGDFTLADIPRLRYEPDVVLTVIPEARRRYDQLTMSLRASHAAWRADGSVTAARLRGNVAGVTGHGTAGTRFSAGPFVRPNEAINFEGTLPGSTEFEAKVWLTARLPRALRAGVLFTHVLGERFTPTFQLAGHYRYVDAQGNDFPSDLFRQVLGQSIFVEQRGSRHYASRTNIDVHVEWRATGRWGTGIVLAADVFNLSGSQAVVSVKTSIDDQSITDPTSYLGAPRLRVAPRTVRLGLRIE